MNKNIDKGNGSAGTVKKIECPQCHAYIPSAHINIKSLIAKCADCDVVFDLPERQTTAGKPQNAPSRPSGISHEVGPGGQLFIKRSWYHPSLYFLLFFCIAWDGFLIFWYSIALVPGANGFNLMAVLFPICHVAVGVWLTYKVVAGFLNTTHLFVDDHLLMVQHRPIPAFGNREIPANDIIGVEIDRVGSENASGRFAVSAHRKDGKQVVLVRWIEKKQADYIAYHLAAKLKVENTDHTSEEEWG